MNISKYLKPAKKFLGAIALSAILGYGPAHASRAYEFREVSMPQVNTINRDRTFMKCNELEAVVSMNNPELRESLSEEQWVYSRRLKGLVEVGKKEEFTLKKDKHGNIKRFESSVLTDQNMLRTLAASEDTLTIYHTHPTALSNPNGLRNTFEDLLNDSSKKRKPLLEVSCIGQNVLPGVSDLTSMVEEDLFHSASNPNLSLKQASRLPGGGVTYYSLTPSGRDFFKGKSKSKIESLMREYHFRKIFPYMFDDVTKMGNDQLQGLSRNLSSKFVKIIFIPERRINEVARKRGINTEKYYTANPTHEAKTPLEPKTQSLVDKIENMVAKDSPKLPPNIHSKLKKVESLKPNTHNEYATYMIGSRAKGIRDLANASEIGVVEESFLHIPQQILGNGKIQKKGLWLENGFNEKYSTVTWMKYSEVETNENLFQKVSNRVNVLEEYHYHPDFEKDMMLNRIMRSQFDPRYGVNSGNSKTKNTPNGFSSNIYGPRESNSAADITQAITHSVNHCRTNPNKIYRAGMVTPSGVVYIQLTKNGNEIYKRASQKEIWGSVNQKLTNAYTEIANEKKHYRSAGEMATDICRRLSNHNINFKFVPMSVVERSYKQTKG